MTRKLIIHDGRAERELLLVGTIVVGRDPSCHISDLDPLLSRRHAEFVTTPRGVTVRDLGSRNGVLVNGAKTREHVLAEGDLIQLGHLQLRYLEDPAAPTREAVIRAHATTAAALDTVTMAAPQHDRRLPVSDTDDTHPHEHPAPLAVVDNDNDTTRVPGRREAPAAAAAADLEVTIAAGSKAPALSARPDLDATVAPGTRDLDATFAPGARALDATFAPGARDIDATFAKTSRDTNATIAPGSMGFDATFVPIGRPATPITAPMADQDHARLVAGADLRVQSANAACSQAFGAQPDALVGQSLTDLVARSLQTLAAGNGPASFSVVLERHPADRTIRATFKTGQTAETIV